MPKTKTDGVCFYTEVKAKRVACKYFSSSVTYCNVQFATHWVNETKDLQVNGLNVIPLWVLHVQYCYIEWVPYCALYCL